MEQFIVSARKYRPQIFEDVVGQQAITNTLENAIKNNHLAQALLFTGPRGVGKTSCARILAKRINQEDQTIVLTYQDTGRGMNKEQLDKLYEPFFTTKRGFGNSGLGMHIVYNLVTQSLDGSIECVSEMDHGVQFKIRFNANNSE